jgi:hypothetical protein
MLKLFFFLAALFLQTGTLDFAYMCRITKDGADCQEVQAKEENEICWCNVVDNSWVFCGCKNPKDMSREEALEYLIYKGKPSEIEV